MLNAKYQFLADCMDQSAMPFGLIDGGKLRLVSGNDALQRLLRLHMVSTGEDFFRQGKALHACLVECQRTAMQQRHSEPQLHQVLELTPVMGADGQVEMASGGSINRSSVSITTQPTHGALSAPDPAHPDQLVYTPNAGFVGTDLFEHLVCDNSTPTPACTATPTRVTLIVPAPPPPPPPPLWVGADDGVKGRGVSTR